MENPLTSEIEWSRHLPSDYEHFVYLGKNIVKRLQDLFIAETKEEAFSMLTKGVHIKIEGDMDVVSVFYPLSIFNFLLFMLAKLLKLPGLQSIPTVIRL